MHRILLTSLALHALLAGGGAFAQESTSFKIRQAVLNAGGRPLGGQSSASTSFLIQPDAIGDAVAGVEMSSASFLLSSGFNSTCPPAGAVMNLLFPDDTTLDWDPVFQATHYHLYRAGPMGTGVGVMGTFDCLPPDVPGTTAIVTDLPPPERAYLYMVNAVGCPGIEGPPAPNGVQCP